MSLQLQPLTNTISYSLHCCMYYYTQKEVFGLERAEGGQEMINFFA